MAYWACARLESQREAVAQHFLKLAGYQVYIPKIREQRLRRSRRVEVVAPLFPAYGFIAIEETMAQRALEHRRHCDHHGRRGASEGVQIK